MAVDANVNDGQTPVAQADAALTEAADHDEDARRWGPPRGAALFAFVMLTAYALYLLTLWITVISRG